MEPAKDFLPSHHILPCAARLERERALVSRKPITRLGNRIKGCKKKGRKTQLGVRGKRKCVGRVIWGLFVAPRFRDGLSYVQPLVGQVKSSTSRDLSKMQASPITRRHCSSCVNSTLLNLGSNLHMVHWKSWKGKRGFLTQKQSLFFLQRNRGTAIYNWLLQPSCTPCFSTGNSVQKQLR